jgi:5-formyltetrahydrofolate cyclo-ligase
VWSTKTGLRKSMLQKRNALSKPAISRRSKLIQKIIIGSSQFRNALAIGAYFAVGSEVKTDNIIMEALRNKKILLLPRIEGEEILFYQILCTKNQLAKGRFGLIEPSPSLSSHALQKIDLLLVPGIAFDHNGYRLGHGRGYYDRFMAKKQFDFSIGLAFSFQILNHTIPHTPVDQKLDCVATEKTMLLCQREQIS